MINTDSSHWRALVAKRVGGDKFDAPGGGYSFSNVLAEERELMKQNVANDPSSALCRLSVADPYLKMPREAMTAGLDYFDADPQATRYKDNNGIPGTHAKIAEYLNVAHPGLAGTLTEDNVQHSPGSIKRLLAEYIPSLFFEMGTHLIFPTPGYGVIKDEINCRRATVHNVPLICDDGQWKLDYAAMNEVLENTASERKKTVLYLNNPHNPTGATMNDAALTNLVEWAIENNVIVVADEAYTNIRFDDSGSILEIPCWEECCIVLQSASKGWGATGLRFGWAVGHATIIKALRKVTDVKDSGLFGPSIAAGLWCLQHPEIARATAASYRALHEKLLEGLQLAGFDSALPQAGLCQFTPAPRAANGIAFAGAIECAQYFRKELRISTMSYPAKDKPGHLRWAVTIGAAPECGLPDEAAVINEVVNRLKSVKLEF